MKYTDIFQVRTNKGRLIGSFHHVEAAEYIAEKGYSRGLFKWMEGKYIHKRTYFKGL